MEIKAMERKETEELREELEWQGQKEKEADLPPPPLIYNIDFSIKKFCCISYRHTHTHFSINNRNKWAHLT